MRAGMLALACGLLLPRGLAELPPAWSWGPLVGILLLCLWRRWFVAALLLAGFAWACLHGHWALAQRLAPELDGRTLWLEGRVVGLPAWRDGNARFELEAVDARVDLPKRLRLSWYAAPELRAGERWRLAVTLRRPHGLANAFGFDYEAWLTADAIGATGSVKDGQRLAAARGPEAWREDWKRRLLAVDAQGRNAYLVALILGDGSGLQRRDWDVLEDTGTLHLMVISGSHISLLGGLLYGLVAGLARLGAWAARLPWLPCACAAGLCGAWGYGWVAGLEVPALRACLMLSMVLLWRLWLRRQGVWMPVLGAVLAVLLVDPLVSLSPGFWLSFAAVGLLVYGFAGRLGRWPWWLTWGRAQVLMAIGLAPLLMALGLPLSPAGALANLLAVPWVELLVVPLALIGSLLLWLPGLGEGLLWLAGGLLDGLLQALAWLARHSPAWYPQAPPAWAIALALLGVPLCLAPAGVPLRAPGLALLLPLFWPHSLAPAPGYAEVRVIDVGQGLSVLIRTHGHAWLYDAGPRRGDFDLGEVAVLPTLRGLGVKRVDTLLLSHADNDHAGGARALLDALPVTRIISGEPERLPARWRAEPCAEREWLVDGVRFSTWSWAAATESNARSCVLRVEAFGESLLLTGDLPAEGEAAWLAAQSRPYADWLMAGHHGSRTSTSAAFVAGLAPRAALISRSRYNAYGHPSAEVLARFAARRVAVHDVAREGALRLLLGRRGAVQGVREKAGFWREK
ncbi:DNA internalization-related competence protein ComEC/Rec2 [Pseudomonas citronellolis]|uniref:DNA internalization-related competence protein ComEC/Rec2 n=1 Tax=Pseudomonas citronellolis TaxID=53408 RepID=UPI0023E3B5E5|nr:DNA internalization-related competence protein ComEC/Rec2 [Pseudomonas citronellolis]MDF3932016.1 DNA internalization-related competence protein ComEC/Rec2 [Pseudomonas citronellolis]